MMRDDKLVRVAIKCGQPIERVVWVYGAILESAAEIDDGGRYDVDPAEIAWFLRADISDVEAIFSGLAALDRVGENGVVKWGDRQFSSDKSAGRQAKYRERKRAGSCRGDLPEGDAEVTSPSRHRDAPETELETETEVSEPKGSSPRAWALPAGVSLQVWTDLLTNRKRKRLPNTDTAWKAFLDDLARVSLQTGIPPPKLVEQCTAKGWGAIYDPKGAENGRSTNGMGRNQPSSDGLSSTGRAGLSVFGPG